MKPFLIIGAISSLLGMGFFEPAYDPKENVIKYVFFDPDPWRVTLCAVLTAICLVLLFFESLED